MTEPAKAWLLAWARFLSVPALFYGVGCFWIAPLVVAPSQRWFAGGSDILFGALLALIHVLITALVYGAFGGFSRKTKTIPPFRARHRPPALSARGFLTRGHASAIDSVERYREKIREQWGKYL